MLSVASGVERVRNMFLMGTYEDFPTASIIESLELADDMYFNQQDTIMTDEQYDALKQYAYRMDPANAYFTGIGSAVRGGKIDLPFKMGSLNQVYLGDFVKWITKYSLEDHNLVITDKLDGASTMLVYTESGDLQIAYSRGDGLQGADITRHARLIHNVPQSIPNTTGASVVVRAENIIPPAKFSSVNTGKYARAGRIYKNPRNMVSGLMNSSENHVAVYKAIDTVAYEIVGSTLSKVDQLQQLARWGFSTVHYSTAVGKLLNDEVLTDLLNKRRAVSEYELDGVVIEVESSPKRSAMYTDELNPEYAVKFKVADVSNTAIVTVKHVEWNVSKDGYLKPRVCIEPVTLVGVTIQHATGFNAKFIVDNKVGPGARLRITRSGDVIPFIQETITPAPGGAELPMEDVVWNATGVDLMLRDVDSSEAVQFERLTDFFSSIDVAHLGDGNLRKIFDMGFTTPEQIIKLLRFEIGTLVGSSAIGNKIYDSLRTKLTNIPLYVLMGSHQAFGRGVGVRKMKKLYEAFNGDMSRCADVNAVIAVEGFDTKTATKIAAGVARFNQFLADIEGLVTIAPFEERKVGKLTGKTVVFTGFRSSELEQRIVDIGGKIGSGVSKQTTFLVTAEPNSTSSKAVKARQLGVTVVGRTEFEGMINE